MKYLITVAIAAIAAVVIFTLWHSPNELPAGDPAKADNVRACERRMGNLGTAIIGDCARAMARYAKGDRSTQTVQAMISPNARHACEVTYPGDAGEVERCEAAAMTGNLASAADRVLAACRNHYRDDEMAAAGCAFRLHAEQDYEDQDARDQAARREAAGIR